MSPRRPDDDVADVVLDHCLPFGELGVVAVLRAYLDESGTHAGSTHVTIAGWVSDPSRWRWLSSRWRTTLRKKKYGVTEAKAADMERRTGQFDGWPYERVFDLRSDLGALIQRHVRYGVSISVVREDYEKIILPGLPEVHEHPFGAFVDPYVWLMASAVGMVLRSPHISPTDRVAFIWDDGHAWKAVAEKFFNWMLRTDQTLGARVVADYSTKASIHFPPLQAADQIVWGSNRGIREDLPANRPFIEMRGLASGDVPIHGGHFAAKELEEVSRNLGHGGAPWDLGGVNPPKRIAGKLVADWIRPIPPP